MQFNSPEFLFLFLPLVWIAFRTMASTPYSNAAIGILVAASLSFYLFFNPLSLGLVAASIVTNFFLGLAISNFRNRRWLLYGGIALNLILLGYYKYSGFFLDTVSSVTGQNLSIGKTLLPIGISFFTFQQLAYLVDCSRGHVTKHDFLKYALFLSFFPRAIAGPILFHKSFTTQFEVKNWFRFDADNLSTGAIFFTLGFFKKIVIADNLGLWVDPFFNSTADPQLFAAWLGSIGFTLQLYFDFSGYSEMALGLGKAFNIDIPLNFASPYKSKSIVDFWRSWHMTLSEFLKNYLYIPLGGNRKGKPRRYVNLMLTMLLGGLWHGAAWTFVLWGGLHGLYLCINHGWGALSKKTGIVLPDFMAWLITFISVNIAWVFFRADSFERGINIIGGMFGFNGNDISKLNVLDWTNFLEEGTFDLNERMLYVATGLFIVLALPPVHKFVSENNRSKSLLSAVVMGVLFVISILSSSRVAAYIYAQF